MLIIVRYLLLFTYHGAFILCQIEIDAEWDQKLVSEHPDYKCGIANKFKNVASSRIINGKRTQNIRYPWMVEVLQFIPQGGGGMCGGTIISDRSILTAAHCICNQYIKYKDKERVTCLIDSDEPRNQNRQENQIHYSFGSKKPIKYPSPKFNKNIRAFIYKYEPKWWDEGTAPKKKKWKNGDAGMIIDDSKKGLNLKRYHGVPICLPSPNAFTKARHEVTLVGRGIIYDEVGSDDAKLTSCVSNGERIHNEIPGNENIKFLPCKNYDRYHPEASCIRVQEATFSKGGKPYPTGYDKKLISTDLKIKFIGPPGKPGHKMEIEIPSDDRCEELSDKVMAATDQIKHDKKFHYFKDDEKGPSRIVVFDNDHENANFKRLFFLWEKMGKSRNHIAHCYNLNRVEEHGICETKSTFQLAATSGEYVKINFGFCGSSCWEFTVRDLFWGNHPLWKEMNRHQWEMKAIYYEDDRSDHFGAGPYVLV